MARVVRGIRLNNPGNIRHSSDRWQGAATSQPDAEFVNFTAPVWGIRAMARILYNYRSEHGATTVARIVSRWAPPEDNNPTAIYIEKVASRMGVRPNLVLDFSPQTMNNLVRAMMIQEIGSVPYADETIREGISLAPVDDVGASSAPVVANNDVKDSPSPIGTLPPDAAGVKIISIETDPIMQGLESIVSSTNSARYCFVNQEFNRNLQVFLLKYAYLAGTYNTEYV